MNTKPGAGVDEVAAGSWASESLPLTVRKALLERELRKLGFGPSAAQRDGAVAASAQQQSESSDRPQADAGEPPGD